MQESMKTEQETMKAAKKEAEQGLLEEEEVEAHCEQSETTQDAGFDEI